MLLHLDNGGENNNMGGMVKIKQTYEEQQTFIENYPNIT